MQLLLPHTNVALGQVLRGELMFHLTEEVRADAVYVGVQAEQQLSKPTLVTERDGYKTAVRTQQETSTRTLFHARTRLDGERVYRSGFYTFEVRLPYAIENTEPSDFDKLLEVVATFKHGITTSRGPVVWHLYGELDIPWSRSLRHKVKLKVSPPLQQGPCYSGPPGVSAVETALCDSCGGPVSAVYGCAGCQEAEEVAPVAARFCTECGEPRVRSARYCGNCGNPIGS